VAHTPWPTEIRLLEGRRLLAVTWDDGVRHEIPAELLRVESPSAEVQGHSRDQKVVLGGKRGVRIMSVQPVGSYAVRLDFDDGHNTGLFEWGLLRRFGEDYEAIFAAYVEALTERGLSRDK
jgi:DUF971 family protein